MLTFTRIAQDPSIMGGKPCIRGLRVQRQIIDFLPGDSGKVSNTETVEL